MTSNRQAQRIGHDTGHKTQRLNESQKAIVRAEGDLFISAGAGTGKTRSIVEKYLALLTHPGIGHGTGVLATVPAIHMHPVDIHSIVAITFTKKAAGEMKSRIVRQLSEDTLIGGNSQRFAPKEADRLLSMIPFAWIDTIHGFCSRILREFSIELNLDPSFEVLNDFQKDQKIRKQILKFLDSAFMGAEPQKLERLLLRFRLDDLLELLRQALTEKRFEIWDVFSSEAEHPLLLPRSLPSYPDSLEKDFGDLFISILKAYEEECTRENSLDFEGLLLNTYKLLKDCPPVRKHLCERFRVIFVDEFQDTNILQKKILDFFWKEGKTNLIFVGDGKQSIYRFNGSEIGIFTTTRDSLPMEKRISLTLNYRSNPVLVDFFNRFFPKVFGQTEGLYGILYEPLEVPEADTVANDVEKTSKKGRVRVIETSENFSEECFKICSYISFLIREENRHPKDFAVLLRKMTKVEEMTTVFEKWGIPYYVVASTNFYLRKEIVSLLSMIKVLYNPADNYSITQLLQSYLSPFSEEELLRIRKNDRGFLFSGLKQYVKEVPENSAFVKKIERLRELLPLLSIGELLREIIAVFDYDLFLATKMDGEKSWLNVKKLLEIADPYSGKTSTREFLEQMSTDHNLKEEEASMESENDDVVKIMSIHKSKGLEFPIVVLPDLGFVQKNVSKPLLTDWWNKKVYFPETIEDASEEEESEEDSLLADTNESAENYEQMKAKEKLREFEENKRLLYVACTRAFDEIVLSFSKKRSKTLNKTPTPPVKGFLPFLYEGGLLNINAEWKKPEETEYADVLSVAAIEKIVRAFQPAEKEIPENTATTFPATVFPIPDRAYQKYLSPSLLTSEPLTEENQEEESFPQLFKVLATVPAILDDHPSQLFNDTAAKTAAQLGTLIHKVLELHPGKDLRYLNLETIESYCRAFGFPYEIAVSAKKKLEKVYNHPKFVELGQATLCYSEKPIRKAWQRYILSGTIDKLYFFENAWHVLDFKVATQNPSFLEKYRFQMQFYLFLVCDLVRPSPQHATLFFLEDGSMVEVVLEKEFEQQLNENISEYERRFREKMDQKSSSYFSRYREEVHG